MLNRIKEIRENLGISQSELASAVGTSRNTISSIESGKSDCSVLLAFKISAVLCYDIEELFVMSHSDFMSTKCIISAVNSYWSRFRQQCN